MATKKYAYYLKGNRFAIAQEGSGSHCSLSGYNDKTSCEDAGGTWYGSSSFGSSDDFGYKSPLSTVTDGLEIEYTYSPLYTMPDDGLLGVTKWPLAGWTVIGGYLAFVAVYSYTAAINWTAAPYSSITSGTSGSTGGDTSDYILIRGSSRWNGVHKVTNSGTTGVLTTGTKVNEVLPYKESTPLHFNNSSNLIYDGTAADPDLFLGTHFSAGDFIFITGSGEATNNGLRIIDDVNISTTIPSNNVVVGDRYIHAIGGTKYPVEETSSTALTDETSGSSDKAFYKIIHEPNTYLLSDIDIMNDENDEVDLTSYQSKALVYYLKAKIAEDAGKFDLREYNMREFKRMLEKERSGRSRGPYVARGTANMRNY